MFAMRALVFLLLLLAATTALADVAVLVEEPYGSFGFFNPTGHAAIYLTNVCAATPLKLRRCEPGEAGVVISRYQTLAGYDWIAMPVIPFFYAVDRLEDVPVNPDRATVQALREKWRREHLQLVAPDGPDGKPPAGDWHELIGVAYGRSTYAFQLESTPEQDDRLIESLNSDPNRRRFNLLFRNCADFARTWINTYYPHAVKRSFLADAGVTTPKQIAKCLVKYGRKHPDLEVSSFIVPQEPGDLGRSKPVRGVFESFVRSKKYVVPLAFFQPWVAGAVGGAYLIGGRFSPSHHAARMRRRTPVWLQTAALTVKGNGAPK